MVGALESLSEAVQKEILYIQASSALRIEDRIVEVYESGDASNLLTQDGFLNVVVRDKFSERMMGWRLAGLKSVDLGIGKTGQKKEVITSEVVGAKITKEGILLHHWNGFVSIFDTKSFLLVEQKFVK